VYVPRGVCVDDVVLAEHREVHVAQVHVEPLGRVGLGFEQPQLLAWRRNYAFAHHVCQLGVRRQFLQIVFSALQHLDTCLLDFLVFYLYWAFHYLCILENKVSAFSLELLEFLEILNFFFFFSDAVQTELFWQVFFVFFPLEVELFVLNPENVVAFIHDVIWQFDIAFSDSVTFTAGFEFGTD